MKAALLAVWLLAWILPGQAEDWKTSDGRVYHQVQVISHDAAYVTILHADGGGRIALSTLDPALQKRFGYDPAKAAAALAATAAADQRNQQALAQEKAISAARAAQGQAALNAAIAQASVPPPPLDAGSPPVPAPDATTAATPPAGPVDPYPAYDDGYGSYIGYSYGPPIYGGYGYGYGGYYGFGGGSGRYSYVRPGGSGFHGYGTGGGARPATGVTAVIGAGGGHSR